MNIGEKTIGMLRLADNKAMLIVNAQDLQQYVITYTLPRSMYECVSVSLSPASFTLS